MTLLTDLTHALCTGLFFTGGRYSCKRVYDNVHQFSGCIEEYA
jgi:hypothetical protein